MTDKLTDEQIIKALECCSKDDCKNCPLSDYDGCKSLLFDGDIVLDLIKRQKAEIERLQYVLMGVMHSVDKWLEGDELKQDETNRAATMREKTLQIVEGKQAEVERLKAEIRNTDNILNLLDRPLVEIKSEAIKEFADRLKGYAKELKIGDNIYLQVVGVGRIDNLVKEMVGE